MKYSHIFTLIFIFSLLIPFPVNAQGGNQWKPARRIPFYEDPYPPYFVADLNKTVHAFNAQHTEEGDSTIRYRQWMLDTGWSKPVDILLPNSAGASLEGVLLDQAGKFHLIFFDGELEHGTGTIEYTTAWATNANQSKAWSAPRTIAIDAGPLISASLTGDGADNLYVVYTRDLNGARLYGVHSSDGGDTWSDPMAISLDGNYEQFPVHIKLELDPENNLHAVWGLVNSTGLGDAVYYARRDAALGTWSEPMILAAREGNDYAADWPSIIYYQGELIVMYMDGTVPLGVPPTRWMRRSQDNGFNWSLPTQPFPHVGEYGPAVMLVDSEDTLHVIVANRVGEPAIGGMWHGTWSGNGWGPLELIASNSPQNSNAPFYDLVDGASIPNAVISQGNIILAAWWHNMPDAPPAGYSYTILDAPEYPQEELPSPPGEPVLPIPTSTEVSSLPTSTPTPVYQIDESTSNGSTLNLSDIITISMASVILLVVLSLVIYRALVQRSR